MAKDDRGPATPAEIAEAHKELDERLKAAQEAEQRRLVAVYHPETADAQYKAEIALPHTKTGAQANPLPDDANALESFVNLPDGDPTRIRDSIQSFRASYPGFFPDSFWGAALPSGKQLFENYLLDTTDTELTPEQIRALPPIPLWRECLRLLREAWRTGFHDANVFQLLGFSIGESEDYLSQAFARLTETKGKSPLAVFHPDFPFHRVILALHRASWRIEVCKKCGKRFLKDKKNQRYCGVPCSSLGYESRKQKYEASGKRPARASSQDERTMKPKKQGRTKR
jgi:hypothetical protein